MQHEQRLKLCFCFSLTESESPEVICPTNQTEFTEPGQLNATVSWEAPAVNSDDEEATEKVSIDVYTCHPRSGWNFKIGQTKVVCEAKNVGQREENMCHFYVNVVGKSAATQIHLYIITCKSIFAYSSCLQNMKCHVTGVSDLVTKDGWTTINHDLSKSNLQIKRLL